MKQRYKLSISILLFTLTLTYVKAQINVQDSLALVDLYNSTNGTGWKIKTNWLSKQPVNTWYGLNVVGGRVNVLTLQNNALRGSLPVSFGDLTQLIIIHFEQDSIMGSLPSSIGKLVNLQTLAFSGNKLSGSIPSSIGNLKQLSYLDLSFNQLSGNIPSELGSLKTLGSIFLNSNRLSGGIPQSIGNLTSLSYLYLDYNELTDTIPESIGNCRNLKTLSLSNNHITGMIPSTIGNMKTLFKLDFSVNQLYGNIPTSIGDIGTLIRMNLNYNSLSGAIPSSIGKMTALTTLNLDNNLLSGAIPPEITAIPGISGFQIYDNNFTFAGMEAVANLAHYSPQATVPLKQKGNVLSVSVGGTPENNTYSWYRNASLVATTTSDSNFTFSSTGKYWVVATNSIANQLVLYSDTITISALPIESISLSGQNYSGNIILQWQTKGETNTTRFSIENSADGVNFYSIIELNTKGNGNNSYQHIVSGIAQNTSVLDSKIYFRIKVIDKQGRYSYSNSISISINLNFSTVSIYPNPLVKSNGINVNARHINEVSIYNMGGKLIATHTFNDATNPKIILNSLSHGFYSVLVKQQDGTLNSLQLICE